MFLLIKDVEAPLTRKKRPLNNFSTPFHGAAPTVSQPLIPLVPIRKLVDRKHQEHKMSGSNHIELWSPANPFETQGTTNCSNLATRLQGNFVAKEIFVAMCAFFDAWRGGEALSSLKMDQTRKTQICVSLLSLIKWKIKYLVCYVMISSTVDCHIAKTIALTLMTENVSVNSSQTCAQCYCNMVKKLFQNEDVAINVPSSFPAQYGAN